jgi:hypothetical protein
MLEASRPVLFLDYFRVPHRVGTAESPPGYAGIRPGRGNAPSLLWRVWDGERPNPRPFLLDGIRLFAALDESHCGEQRELPTVAPRREPDGTVVLPFDIDEAITAFWSEAYTAATAAGSRSKRLATRAYYRARPFLPRRTQIAMRRVLARVQARTAFPRWPVETALHDLYRFLFAELERLSEEPLPWIAPWPSPYTWALVLSHDVERRVGYHNLHVLGDVERALGFRSSWHLVPARDYVVEDERIKRLRDDGFEVGVHGLYHDGRDLESVEVVHERLPAIRTHAERWRAAGFRSPATHRDWRLMPLLGFDYDASYPDTDPFEPQSGGCCTWLPFMNGNVVELPLTLTMDHTLFVILNRRDESLWIEKTEFLRQHGGLAQLLTHPDYMLAPELVAAYRRYLERYARDESVWKPLPREVSSWWRRRRESSLERSGGSWRVVGPAAEAANVSFGWTFPRP